MTNINGASSVNDRQGHLNRLLDAVKQCQVRFGGKKELATDSDSRVSCLCSSWEVVLQHGMRHTKKALSTLKQVSEMTGLTKMTGVLAEIKNLETEPAFWQFVKEYLNKHELQRYAMLKNIHTDAGRGRAWLRSAFNEHSLERYMHMMIGDDSLLVQYYEDWAFLRDQERSSMLPMMAAGLGSILFAITIDDPELNTIRPAQGLLDLPFNHAMAPVHDEDQKPVIAGEAAINENVKVKKEKRKKKKVAKLVSFDENTGSSSTRPRVVSPEPNFSPALSDKSFDSAFSADYYMTNILPQEKAPDLLTSSLAEPLVSTSASSSTGTFVTPRSDTDINVTASYQASAPEANSTLSNVKSNSFSSLVSENGHSGNSQMRNQPGASLSPENQAELNTSAINESFVTNLQKLDTSLGTGSADRQGLSLTGLTLGQRVVPLVELNQGAIKDDQSEVSSIYTSAPTSPVSLTSGTTFDTPPPPVERRLTTGIRRSPSQTSRASSTSESDYGMLFVASTESGAPLTPITNSSGSASDFMMTMCSKTDDTASVDSANLPDYSSYSESGVYALAIAQRGLIESHSSHGLRTAGDGSYGPEKMDSPGPVKHETMSTEELKQAVVAMMLRKDEVEEQNRCLRNMLDQEIEMSAGLKAEMEEIRKEDQSVAERDQSKIQALSRENELLKHQLKKYVNAVQLLRREGLAAEAKTGIHLDAPQPPLPPEKPAVDYSFEASEFEKKLIQVAEMHGELMEFNEVLHRQLNAKENELKRLKQDIIELRGPLGYDGQSTDNLSISSDSDMMSAASRPIVNIWIPSVFLRGTGSDAHHVYQLYIRIRDVEWNVYRRYAQFHELHVKIKKHNPILNTFEFPPKKALGNKSNKFVEERRRKLQTYIRRVLNWMLQKHADVAGSITKEKLIEIIPLLGDIPPPDKKGRKKTPAKAATSQPEPPTTPQYQGL
ncbi:sorting nexin-29-like isoform X2 [Lineus longissimus]|uniref:sorting nexin-29-like isoform X2 n=1 Tax=Lineus longissimus TaxID=88925 RepID=UPI002B4D1F0E